MLGVMRLACATLVGAVLIALPLSADVGAAPRGKVVRVERARTSPTVIPAICFQFSNGGQGMCIGRQPKTDESIILMDEQQVVAEIRIGQVTAAKLGCDAVWNVEGSVVSGDVSAGRRSKTMGLIDGNVDRKAARMVPEDKIAKPVPDAKVAIGMDRDGDGQSDVVITQSKCPTGTGDCIDFWTRRTKGLEKVWTSSLDTCTP